MNSIFCFILPFYCPSFQPFSRLRRAVSRLLPTAFQVCISHHVVHQIGKSDFYSGPQPPDTAYPSADHRVQPGINMLNPCSNRRPLSIHPLLENTQWMITIPFPIDLVFNPAFFQLFHRSPPICRRYPPTRIYPYYPDQRDRKASGCRAHRQESPHNP